MSRESPCECRVWQQQPHPMGTEPPRGLLLPCTPATNSHQGWELQLEGTTFMPWRWVTDPLNLCHCGWIRARRDASNCNGRLKSGVFFWTRKPHDQRWLNGEPDHFLTPEAQSHSPWLFYFVQGREKVTSITSLLYERYRFPFSNCLEHTDQIHAGTKQSL